MDFIVEVSARHVHLTQEHVEALFGKGHELTFDRPLSQPGQFLSKEKVTIKNGDRKIERVSILGPVRKASQVEVSKTDSVALRAEGFIRESGDLAGTAPVEIEGPEGSIQLSEGLIIAKRHIHMTPAHAAEAGRGRGRKGGSKVRMLSALLLTPTDARPFSAMLSFASAPPSPLQCISTPMKPTVQTFPAADVRVIL